MKTLSKFTLAILLLSGVVMLVTRLTAAAQPGAKPQEQTKSQPQPKPKTVQEQRQEIARRERANEDARELLGDCQGTFEDRTYQADLHETAHIGGRSFIATGRYIKGRGLRMLLELNMEFGPKGQRTKASLLQICDGQILISSQTVGSRKPRVTRRNVQQIHQAAENVDPARKRQFNSAVGLGGIPELLASLPRTMAFDEYKSVKIGSQRVWKLGGTWNSVYKAGFLRQGGGAMPAHVPDRVTITIDSAYRLRKIEYLKRESADGALKPMLTLEFKNIKLNDPKVDDQLFRLPKQTVSPLDVTNRYLDLLRRPAGQ